MIKIITDSGSDISQEEAKKLNIEVIPIVTRFSDHEYFDGVSLSHDEFYKLLSEKNEFPKTAQVNPASYMKAFEKEINSGNEVLCITLGSKLSGCYQSALLASKNFENGKIHVFDSNSGSVGERNLVYLAMECFRKDMSLGETVSYMEEKKNDSVTIAALDTLEYLEKGGRISKTAALLGAMLSIKPVIELKNGSIKLIGKARGYKNAHNLLTKTLEKYGGIDFSLPVSVGYSGQSKELLEKYLESNRGLYQDKIPELPIYQIGAAIGTHCGPGTIVLSFFRKED